MVLVVLVVAAIGFGIAKMIRYYTKLQRKGLLDPPVNLLEGITFVFLKLTLAHPLKWILY